MDTKEKEYTPKGDGIAIVSEYHPNQNSLLFSDKKGIPLDFFSEGALEVSENNP